jgi:hypothetical protein
MFAMNVCGPRRAPLLLALAAGLGLAGASCAISPVQTPTCVNDDACGPGNACMAGSCIPEGVPEGTWAIELVPRSDSNAAITRRSSVDFRGDVTVLTADSKVTVTATLPTGSAFENASHMVATVRTGIPGYTDLIFEADSSSSSPTFTFKVPAGALHQMTTFRLVPLPPRAVAQPPVEIVLPLTESVNLNYSSDYYFISGRVVSQALDTRGAFTVRVFQGGQLVSDVSAALDGVIRSAVPTAAAFARTGQMVTLELSVTVDDAGTVRRFSTPPFRLTGNLDLGNLTFPAMPPPAIYRLRIADPSNKPVAGVVVRAHADLSVDGSGAIDFTRDGTSDSNGNVDLTLIAGTAAAPQSYDIAVQPPASSRFGSACATGFLINDETPTTTAGAAANAPVATILSVPEKPTLPGKILSADGTLVAGVNILATRVGAGAATSCGKAVLAPPQITATSNRSGAYQLLLDPGIYQFDYDPPAGAPVPRLTETSVAVNVGSNVGRVVQMLPGALIKGQVNGPDQNGLALAGVRFLEIACKGTDACYGRNRVGPILRGETHTDADGTFRAVVPLQLPAP